MQVHKNKRRVAVTPLEFGILHLLAGNAGTVVAADQLLHEVWQADVGDSVARVKVHLSHLRQKLQEAGGKPLVIRALPRVGYMLMVPRTHTRTAVRQTTGHQSATPLPMLDDGERSSSLIERGEGDLITRFRAATGSGGQ
jgi:DNA-binding winged helix-turn-helix (wHTH) protein